MPHSAKTALCTLGDCDEAKVETHYCDKYDQICEFCGALYRCQQAKACADGASDYLDSVENIVQILKPASKKKETEARSNFDHGSRFAPHHKNHVVEPGGGAGDARAGDRDEGVACELGRFAAARERDSHFALGSERKWKGFWRCAAPKR